MRAWVFFHRPVDPVEPEAIEILRVQETASRLGVTLDVLRPQEFDLVVRTKRGWSAIYHGEQLERPDLIIPRTGSETTYFMTAVMRHFERQGVAMINGSAAVEADADFIFQRYVRASHGRDVRVLVVNGDAVAAMERRSTDGGFKSNISLGGHGQRFEAPPEMARLAERVAAVLSLDIVGIDILFDEDGYRIGEANSSPGFQGLEAACDIDVAAIMFHAMAEKLRLKLGREPVTWRSRLRNASRTLVDVLEEANA